MFVVFNILVIALVLLIAYWWANQGLFSAILHLACVVVAGAIAFAAWEPLTLGLLLRGTMFDDYAWGTALIGVFALSLLVLRVIMDKVAPGNVALPQWLNLGLGFPVGAASGILTIGIFIIGMGFIQSARDIMGFTGMVRTRGESITHENSLWVPVHRLTGEFYSFVSAGSLYPTFNNTPLRQYNPDIHYQAASLVRDSAPVKNIEGRGKLSLRPADAQVQDFLWDPQAGRYLVKVRFLSGARDFGEQLTLSSAQIRLIGSARDFDKPKVVFPDQWTQHDGLHRFDDPTHYITSEPGQSEATVLIEFPAAGFANVHPRFLQIRNTRYRLPAPQETSLATARSGAADSGERTTIDRSAPNIQDSVRLSNDINPVIASTNQKPGGIHVNEERFITGGQGEFANRGERPSRSLMIQGIFEPAGTKIVQVDISRESRATIYGMIGDSAGPNAKIVLVDAQGRTYQPVGYIHQKPGNITEIKVDFQRYLSTMRDLPSLPTAGGQTLRLLFSVTEGATVAGLKVGDITVGICNLVVADQRRTPPPASEPTPTAGSRPE